MGTNRKNLVMAACRHALRPIIRFLLRNGMTFKEFSEMGKSVYVDVASTDYGIGGRPTNASRVAILTGLTRREAKRQRDLLWAAQARREGTENLATRILTGWHEDADFLDDSGQPLELPITGDATSFSALLDRYSGDVPPTAMLKELISVGAVKTIGPDRLRVISRSYIPVQLDDASIRQWSVALHDLGDTINHNTDTTRTEEPRYERMAINSFIDGAVAAEFRRLVARHGQEFLEGMDRWLSEHEVPDSSDACDKKKRLGVGLYFIEDEQESLS